MKTFLYTKTTGKRRISGGCNLTFYIYRITRNEPVYLGKTTACSASYPGDRITVKNFLVKTKHIPKYHYNSYVIPAKAKSINLFRL